MNKLIVGIGFAGLVVMIFFGIREPMTLIFIIPTFIFLCNFFQKRSVKIRFDNNLSKSEVTASLRSNAISFCLLSIIANSGFLLWVNSITPLWGVAHSDKERVESAINAAKYEKIQTEREWAIKVADAQRSVEKVLKDPSSAMFSGEKVGSGGSVCGYVNAKNSFGAFTGDARYVYVGGMALIDDGSSNFSQSWNQSCK